VERIWGCSYSRFMVEYQGVCLERTVFVPFGDCPLLVAHIRLTNLGTTAQKLAHIEYWDLHLHNIDYNHVTPWAPDQAARDKLSARLYTGYACNWDEKLEALIARHPWGPASSEPSLNWPSPTASNRPDIFFKPLGFKPDRQTRWILN